MSRRVVALLATASLAINWGCGNGSAVKPESDALRAALEIPFFRNSLNAEIVETWNRRDLVFERVRFQGRYRQIIPALVCYSELARFRPLPAVLYMPGTPSRKADLLQPQALMPRWADEGYFVVSIDRPYHGDRPGDLGTAIESKGLAKVWGEVVFDLMCTLDYLVTREEVDPSRIGMLGWSMGGMEALLVSALDDRVTAVVSAIGHLSWEEIFAKGAWRLIFSGLPITKELVDTGADAESAHETFLRQFAGIRQADAAAAASLIAPRPLLLLAGESDSYVPNEATTRVFHTASSRYQSYAQVERLSMWIEPAVGHQFTTAMEAKALDWFNRWLETKADGSQRVSGGPSLGEG